MDIYKDNKMHTCPKCAVILPHNIFLLFYKKSPDIFMPLHSIFQQEKIIGNSVNRQEEQIILHSITTITLRLTMTFTFFKKKSFVVFTVHQLPLGNGALSSMAKGIFVYIVWLIACKKHNELLMSCATDPAVTVCLVNVIRDWVSCPWWAHCAVVFALTCGIFLSIRQDSTECRQVRLFLWMIMFT